MAWAAPKVILISLDGATPWLLNQCLASRVLSRGKGIGLLQSQGIGALQNITISPSHTAPGRIAVATGISNQPYPPVVEPAHRRLHGPLRRLRRSRGAGL